jgi:predicted O-methyltransferase YrrM
VDIDRLLTPEQREVRALLAQRDADERSRGERTSQSAMAVSAGVAEMLYLLVLQKPARRIAEFGTSLGYSTLHLAAAASRTDGRVYSVDAIAEKTLEAQANLDRAGLSDWVHLATADGADWVRMLPFELDLVLIDYAVGSLAPALDALCERVAPSGLVFVDGGPEGYWATGHGAAFAGRLRDRVGWAVSILPMQKEQLIAVRLWQSESPR